MENITDSGFRGARGRQFFIPFKEAESRKTDFEAEPGEIAFSTGLAGDEDKVMKEHLTGECGDICTTPGPVPATFPQIHAPQIDIEGVQIKFPPVKNAWHERVHSSGTTEATNEAYLLLVKLIEGTTGGRTSQELEELKAHIQTSAHAFMQEMEPLAAERDSLLRSATITTALRLKDGRHCQWSAPVTLRPNDAAWGVEVDNLQFAGNALLYRLTANPMPWRPAIRIPDTPANREWRQRVSAPETGGCFEALDIFICYSKYPDTDSERNSMVRFGYSSAMPYIERPGSISYPEPEEISGWGLRIGGEWREKEAPEVFNPEEYRLAASIPINSLPDYDEWIEVPVKIPSEKGEAAEEPDYEADIPGQGELMLKNEGREITVNPSFAIPTPTALPADGREIFSGTPSVREEGLRSLFVLISHRGAGKWYAAESADWRGGETPEWIFYPMAEGAAIAEEKSEGGMIRHRIFPLTRLKTGGARWNRGISGLPEWEPGPFSPQEPIENSSDGYPLKSPGTILCGEREYPGIYPSSARLTLPEEGGRIVSLIEYYGSGTPAGSLIAFSEEEIRLLYAKEIKAEGVTVRGLSDAGLIDRIGVKGYRQTVGMPSGALFVAGGGVWKGNKSGVERIGDRGSNLPDDLTLRYHSFAEIIEACDAEGRVAWRYDAIKNEQMRLLPVSIADFLKDEGIEVALPEESGWGDYAVTLVTRPFRITEAGPVAIAKSGGREGVPLIFRFYAVPAILPSRSDLTQSGSATYPEAADDDSVITGVMVSEDLRTWRVVYSQGMVVGPVLPVAAKPGVGRMRFYRLIYLSRGGNMRPAGCVFEA